MLITCPECELPVSDKAIACPHCGNPMRSTTPRKSNKSKRMRLPNGFGQITEIKSKNLRKPFRAMVSIGKKDNGRPICVLLKPEAYFETYNEAYLALMEYNKNPYSLDDAGMTVEELYNKWSEQYFAKIKCSSKRTITSAWAYCNPIKNIRCKEVRVGHIKACMDTCNSDNTKNRIKSMFNLMFDYALEFGIVDKNYARDFKVAAVEPESQHKSFTEEEMNKLWSDSARPLTNIILLQCYTGWRPQELCLIKLEDVDLDKMTMTGGMKTEAGTGRVVPICKKAQPLVKNLYNLAKMLNCSYLLCDNNGDVLTYDMYYKKFMSLMKEYNFDHRPHDPRKQFITMCKNAGVDEYAIKYLVGHKISDLTEKTYTDRDLETWLAEEVEKI